MSMTLMVAAMSAKVGNPLRKLVLIKLADNANDKGECWPSYQHIADQCEIGRSTVKSHIRELEKMGFLVRIFRRDGEINKSNIFRLNLDVKGGAESDRVGQDLTGGGAGADLGGGAGADPRTSHSFEPVIETKEMAKTKKRFSPPSVGDVRLYCIERKNGIDAEMFVDHYNSNGWMVGRNRMKDWRAAVRQWERRRSDYNRSQSAGQSPARPGSYQGVEI